MKDNQIWLVIPTADRHDYLQHIFESSGVPPEQIIVVRTSQGTSISGAINLWVEGELNIHKWWNTGINYCRKAGARYVAVLNDDTVIRKGDLDKLLAGMKSDQSTLALPVSKGEAGWGHCWLLDTSHEVFPDERFQWWCGDHDLEIRALKSNGVTYLPLSILNKHANELTVESHILQALTRKDINAFRRKYPSRALAEFFEKLKKRILKI